MNMKFLFALFASLFVTVGSYAQSTEINTDEVSQYDVDRAAAPIKSRLDLQKYLADKSKSNPLNKLSKDARARLAESIVWGEGDTIASLYMGDIRRELRPLDAYRVLQLFGFQSLAPTINNGKISSAVDKFVV